MCSSIMSRIALFKPSQIFVHFDSLKLKTITCRYFHSLLSIAVYTVAIIFNVLILIEGALRIHKRIQT